MLSQKDKKIYKRQILGVRSLHIPGSNFVGRSEGLKYKQAIQELYCENYFQNIQPEDLLNDVTKNGLNNLIDKMKMSHQYFDVVFNYKPNGIGPGEVMLYFLINNSYLGGFKTGDLVVGNTTYEVKTPNVVARGGMNVATDVRLASIKNLDSVYYKLLTLQKRYNLSTLEKSQIDMIKQKEPENFKAIEAEFKDKVEEYFSNKVAIFLNGKASQRGRVEAVKKVKANEVTLNRITAREFKADIVL